MVRDFFHQQYFGLLTNRRFPVTPSPQTPPLPDAYRHETIPTYILQPIVRSCTSKSDSLGLLSSNLWKLHRSTAETTIRRILNIAMENSNHEFQDVVCPEKLWGDFPAIVFLVFWGGRYPPFEPAGFFITKLDS